MNSTKNDNSVAEYVYNNSTKKVPLKIQIELNRTLIEKSIKEKIPHKHLYEKLVSENKISCSYTSFCAELRKMTYVELKTETTATTETPKPEKFQPVQQEKKQFKPIVNTDDLKDSLF